MEKYEPAVKHHHHHHRSPSNHHQQQQHKGHMTMSHLASNHNNNNNNNNNNNKTNYLNEIQSDYAYAYYEPGAPMRHQNIPTSAVFYEEAGPSRPPPPNSIRAIISTARRNAMQRNSQRSLSMSSNEIDVHANPGTAASTSTQQTLQKSSDKPENLYEEINDAEKKKIMMNSESIMSLNQCLVEEEFRRVHNRHRRVLDELNLDVEEMLMPSIQLSHSPSPPPQPAFIQTSPMSEPTMPTDTMDFLGNSEETDGSNGAGNYSISNNMDLDSGFSGSNSSYIGSLRYQKSTTPTTAAAIALNTMKAKAPAILELPINHQHADSNSSFYGGSMLSDRDEIAMIACNSLSSRSSSSNLYDSAKMMHKLKALSISPTHHHPHHHHHHHHMQHLQQNLKSNDTKNSSGKFTAFWKGKGWKSKLPGFSSTSSINKIGVESKNFHVTNLKFNYDSSVGLHIGH